MHRRRGSCVFRHTIVHFCVSVYYSNATTRFSDSIFKLLNRYNLVTVILLMRNNGKYTIDIVMNLSVIILIVIEVFELVIQTSFCFRIGIRCQFHDVWLMNGAPVHA